MLFGSMTWPKHAGEIVMVAIYIAGFVIVFAVANVIYEALASSAMKGRTRISATNLAHASPDEPVIVLGSSRRLSRSDLLLENMALRQELLVSRARRPKPRLVPDNGSGLGPLAARGDAPPTEELRQRSSGPTGSVS
jgi:hypothetical protein